MQLGASRPRRCHDHGTDTTLENFHMENMDINEITYFWHMEYMGYMEYIPYMDIPSSKVKVLES